MKKIGSIAGVILLALFAAACGVVEPTERTVSATPVNKVDIVPTLPPTGLTITHQLQVVANPPEAAEFLLNPKQHEQGGYVPGSTVTIDVLPKPGWKVEEWFGPVFGESGTTANIDMNASQTVIVRLIEVEVPKATPAPTPVPPSAQSDASVPTIVPTAIPVPTFTPLPEPTTGRVAIPTLAPVPVPTPIVIVVPTPTPAPKPTQKPTTTPLPTSTLIPTATPTPLGPPTPTLPPRYRLYVNGLLVPALNSLMPVDAGTVTISRPPGSDGSYEAGAEIVLVAGTPAGYVAVWGGSDGQRGSFATVYMVADRHVTVRMLLPTPTPGAASIAVPYQFSAATPTPAPAPVPVPTAVPVVLSPTPTPVPPTPTDTPQPPGEPTHTPTPVPTATPIPAATATPLPTATPVPAPTATPTPSPTSTPTPSVPAGADDIVFVSKRDGLPQIYTMAPDGTNQHRLTTPEDAVSPSWSADKTKIVFISGGHNIAVMDSDGSNLYTAVTEAAVYGVSGPDLSPDGSKIVTGGNLEGLYVVNVDGSNVTQITSGRDSAPDWSPDGTKILFTRSTPAENKDLYTVNPDGTNLVRLTTTEFDEVAPAWSPDGTKIAFEYLTDAWTMNADGTNRIDVGGNGDQSRLAWSPDGSKLTFTQACSAPACPVYNNEVWTMNGDGTNRVNISNHSAMTRRAIGRRLGLRLSAIANQSPVQGIV